MAERQCTIADNQASAAQAGTGNLYGPAAVTVVEADTPHNMVKLRVQGAGGAPTEIKFTWIRANVWALCPSTLECTEAVLPQVNATGILYLSRALVESEHLPVDLKWPNAFPVPPEYRPLRIWPVSLRLEGIELASGDMVRRTIDLLDPTVAQPGQVLELANQTMEIGLSQTAWFDFGVQWPHVTALRQAVETLKADPCLTSSIEKARAWAEIAAWETIVRNPAHKQGDAKHEAEVLLAELT